jgi:putative membrane protein
MWGWNGHMGWGGMVFWVIVILLLLGVVAWFALSASRRNGSRPAEETPERVAKRRYARGEIDRQTYQRLLEDLRR